MITLSSKELNLKNLIEGNGVGGQNNAMLSGLTLRAMGARLDGITYEEAISMVKQNNEILEHTPISDPAYEFLVRSRNEMLKYASALNDVEILGRHDHEIPIHALVSIDGITVECNFYIPQLGHYPSRRKQQIDSTLRRAISFSSDWSGGFRRPAEIDFVEL